MIIYLHGFNSSGASEKAQRLKHYFAKETVLNPSYHYDPIIAVEQLQELLEQYRNQAIMLVGSSLGAFYAQYLSRLYPCCVVMINPALQPITTLRPHLGKHTNYYTLEEYRFEQKHIDYLQTLDVSNGCAGDVATLIVLDKGDELIPYQYAIEKYSQCAEFEIFDGGNHGFAHMSLALPVIDNFYRRYQKSYK